MDYVDYQWVREHVQHHIKGVREEMREFAEELGKITGTAEKERREQATLLRNLETLIEKQAKLIESQGERLKSIEAVFGRPSAEASVDPTRRLS